MMLAGKAVRRWTTFGVAILIAACGGGGGTSPAMNALGAWQPLHPARTPATFGSMAACGTASLKYSISSQWCVYDWDIMDCCHCM